MHEVNHWRDPKPGIITIMLGLFFEKVIMDGLLKKGAEGVKHNVKRDANLSGKRTGVEKWKISYHM